MRSVISKPAFQSSLQAAGLTPKETAEVLAWVQNSIPKLECSLPSYEIVTKVVDTLTGPDLITYLLYWAISEGEIGRLDSLAADGNTLQMDAYGIGLAAVELGFGRPESSPDDPDDPPIAQDLTAREKILTRFDMLREQVG